MEKTTDTVTLTLFKDGDRYKDDLTVGVNGKFWTIQRGVPVTVPRCVAEVIEAHVRAENEANERMNRYSEMYRERAEELKL